MKLEIAKKESLKLKIGLSGASGFGKTYSALLMAYGIIRDWSKIAVIDSENNSASLYSNLGQFRTLDLKPPYTPERFIEAIELCENNGVEIIIIDSISHEWNGKGGCLEIQEQLGGRFQDWAKVTPRHNAFIEAILSSKCHVITTVRRKTDYSLDVVGNGKTKVIKHGTKEITRDGFEYELTVNFEVINDNHLVRASKDRTSLFIDKPEFVIGIETGKLLSNWCKSTAEDYLEVISKEIESCDTLEGLRHVYKKHINHREEILPKLQTRKQEIEQPEQQMIDSKKHRLIMEQIVSKQQFIDDSEIVEADLKGNTFIGGKAVEVSLQHLKDDCIIPVFSKDNESTISHYEFVNEMQNAIKTASPSINITRPLVKVSHTVKGRIPSAIGKPVKELKENEKTIYYERCAFIFQILGKSENVNGNDLNLTIGGVRAYNQENLYSTKSLEKFKIFIGYQNMVCTNLCISTDGFSDEVKVGSIVDLADHVMSLVENYDMKRHLGMLERMSKFSLSQDQFAHLIGKLRIYNHLDKKSRSDLPQVLLTDNHINHVAKSYLNDPDFGCDSEGNINLWQLYNLLTDANKASYIDNNLEPNVNAYELMNKLGDSMLYEEPNWFLHHFI